MNSSRQRPVRFEKIFFILILSNVFTNNFKYQGFLPYYITNIGNLETK